MNEIQELSADEVFGFKPDEAFFVHIEECYLKQRPEFNRCTKCKEINEVGEICCGQITTL
jgi:hypothetical protein